MLGKCNTIQPKGPFDYSLYRARGVGERERRAKLARVEREIAQAPAAQATFLQ